MKLQTGCQCPNRQVLNIISSNDCGAGTTAARQHEGTRPSTSKTLVIIIKWKFNMTEEETWIKMLFYWEYRWINTSQSVLYRKLIKKHVVTKIWNVKEPFQIIFLFVNLACYKIRVFKRGSVARRASTKIKVF